MALVLVCKKLSDIPHKNAQTKQRGKEEVNRQIKEINPATSTIKLPKIASLNLEKSSAKRFIKSPFKS